MPDELPMCWLCNDISLYLFTDLFVFVKNIKVFVYWLADNKCMCVTMCYNVSYVCK